MAIKTHSSEQLAERGLDPSTFCGHYSDEGYYIKKAGTEEVYAEAIDITPLQYEYIETDVKIEKEKVPGMKLFETF